jgi:cellobiose transport system substrate-binding protein
MSSKNFSNMKLRMVIASVATAVIGLGVFTAPAKAADPVTITIWTFGDVIQRNLVAEYKALHPEVTLQIKKSDLDPLDGTNMVTACTSKTGPDIVATEVSYSGYWRSYPKCFTDLRTMKTTGEPTANIPAGQSATDIKANYLPWRWQQGVAFDGSVIGIPTDVGGLEVAYRSDLFKKAGLPTERGAVAKLWPTWDKFIATGVKYNAKLSAANKKAGMGFIDNAGTIYAAIMNQGTAKYYANDGSENGKLIYDTNPQVKLAWNTTIKATQAGIGTRIGQYTSDWNIGMNKGTFATILAPAWMMDYIKAQAPDTAGKWDIADMPGGGGNQGGTQLGIPSYAQNKQAAYDFLTWYLAPAQQLKVFKTYGLFPSASVLYKDPALTGFKDPFFNNAPVGIIYAEGVQKLKPIFEGKLQRAIDQAIGAGLGRVSAKKMTAEKSWAQVLSDLKKVVNN